MRQTVFVLIVTLIVIYFFPLSNPIVASGNTSLDFTSSIWEFSPNSGVYVINSRYLKLEAGSTNTNMFPYLRTTEKIFPEIGPINIYVDFKYLGTVGFGSGIAISPGIPQPNNTDIDATVTDYILFNIWQDASDGFFIYAYICPSNNLSCVLPVKIRIKPIQEGESIYDFTNHNIKFEYTDSGVYKIYADGSLAPIFISSINQRRPYGMWMGHSIHTSTTSSWSSFEVNNISFDNFSENDPFLIIPGLGASWDIGAILTGNTEGDWQVPDFVTQYDGLINSFVNAGYVKNTNLFVFSYDWRKPLDVLADRLEEYINTYIPAGQKVNIVGHSMGGLVARAYAQKNGISRINKIVTVGSPNMGATEAYGVWEGATVWNDVWWAKVALELTTHFGAQSNEIQTVRNLVPSIKDLLPTYDFIKLNDQIVPSSSLSFKNEALNTMNLEVSSIDSLTTAMYSNNVPTNKFIKVVSPSAEDIALNRWVDGKPIDNPFEQVSGDGTVTDESAKGLFSNTLQGTWWHGELVTKKENIQKIFGVFGLDINRALDGTVDNRRDVFVVSLRSPGILEVCNVELTSCNNQLGIYLPDNKLFMFPGYDNQSLVVKITENGELDKYKLHLGNINNTSNWEVIDGKLTTSGQVDLYNVSSDGGDFTANLVDTVAPSIPIITGFHNPELPCGGTTNQHMATVDWTDSYDLYGVEGYEYSVDFPSNSGRGQWKTFFTNSEYRGSLNEGVHNIKVRAKDRFGNYSDWSNTCSITADWTSPIVTISSPVPGIYKPDSLPKLKYVATDNLDLDLTLVDSGMPKSVGQHTVTVTATDNAGNIGSSSVKYIIEKPAASYDQCKKNGWRYLWLLRFRNQGECISYFERLDNLRYFFHNHISLWRWIK